MVWEQHWLEDTDQDLLDVIILCPERENISLQVMKVADCLDGFAGISSLSVAIWDAH